MRYLYAFILLWCLVAACDDDDTPQGTLALQRVFAGDLELSTQTQTLNVPVDRSIALVFSAPVDATTLGAISLATASGQSVPIQSSVGSSGASVNISPVGTLNNNTVYTLSVSEQLKGASGEAFQATDVSFKTMMSPLTLLSLTVGMNDVTTGTAIQDVPLNGNFTFQFSTAIDPATLQSAFTISGPGAPPKVVTLSADQRTVSLNTSSPLKHFTRYQLSVQNTLKGLGGETFAGVTRQFYTGEPTALQMPVISDEELLTKVQQETFKYFWDFAHPASGMARERTTSGDLVTAGGSGFGMMALIVGVERGFITRAEALARMDRILDFLETADRFHGAWPHWMNGNTGDVIPFSPNDNGGDLVETSFLIQGLLTFRQYLDATIDEEASLRSRINALWEGVEWDWYRREGQNVLYWHWSPDKQWTMNLPIKGYNECLITYVLAASSPTHDIPPDVYQQGWASNGSIQNGKTFYGVTLPLGYDYGGPLFFAHYSFLGLDPRNLSDPYANYWTQNVSHSMINYQHAVINPKKFVGYSDNNWGLTASDNHLGYSAHSPTNDLGVISPTAALSSFPYTPEESMKAMKFFYYKLGDRLWGQYGFYDAFNLTEQWTADQYLAIDQGPIIVMIENYRTGLLWDLFMSAPEVKAGLTKLNFTY